ncbi:hypothetical protein [Jeotgalibacillus haloalkalitolerans]|uniref:Uncharacterized protein n=1 Tax=Jeotgalibacillus haloalkalitolerans TaxID=3104292 RepID=A0ABU5KPE4_9BACL|nr:hypothetical protein [Jeotgalibacillus sp. HH7-29]MDZ5713050.1 hypothetical protein [Jeotgalibacillus sp. HH7-29]
MQNSETTETRQKPKIYKAHTERIQISLMALALVPFLAFSWDEPIYRFSFIALMIYHILLLFIQYSFSIQDSRLIYSVFFIKWRIRTRELNHSDISQIQFRRENWAAKAAILKTYKGRSPRLYKFDGNDLFHRLEEYCYEYRVPLKKSNDYLILEDMYKKDAD